VIANSITLGEFAGSSGSWKMYDGAIQVSDALINADSTAGPKEQPRIVVGNQGTGQVVIHASRRGVAIQESEDTTGGSLYIRATEVGDGLFSGWGAVRLTGPIVQNGKVIADGFGSQHFLDMSSARSVRNTIDNPADGDNGWYARNGGSLLLPPIDITSDGVYTWGEDPADPVIDLVNSMRLNIRGVTTKGFASLTLLSADEATLPALPDGLDPLSLWLFQSTAEFTSLNLTLRYDELAARAAGLDEHDLGIWVFNEGWTPIINLTAGIDVDKNLLWGSAGRPTYIAIADVSGVPEPTGIGLLFAAGVLLRRRPRR